MDRKIPWYFWIGLLFIAVFWWCNWNIEGYRTHWSFSPLWLGYILVVDGLNVRMHGQSPIRRNSALFLVLFVISAPSWWLFEALNQRAGYWEYLGVDSFSTLSYATYCTMNFSVVMPAVFETAELYFRSSGNAYSFGAFGTKNWQKISVFVLGWLMLAVVLIWPRYGLAFLWISLFFILDPLNARLGFPSLLKKTGRGNWSVVWSLFAAGLTCGFFWELWNLHSWPKWIYNVPFVDFWFIFEMPLLGYLGYLPFSLELYALAAFIFGLFGSTDYIDRLFLR